MKKLDLCFMACLVLMPCIAMSLSGCGKTSRNSGSNGSTDLSGAKFKAGDIVYAKIDGRRFLVIGIKKNSYGRTVCDLRFKVDDSADPYGSMSLYEEELSKTKEETKE